MGPQEFYLDNFEFGWSSYEYEYDVSFFSIDLKNKKRLMDTARIILILVLVALLAYAIMQLHHYGTHEKHFAQTYARVNIVPNGNIPGPDPSPEMIEFIVNMPKTSLHIHIESALEPQMAFALAQKYKMLPLKVPKVGGGFHVVHTLAELEDVYNFDDLESFLNVYNTLGTLLRSQEDFKNLALHYVSRAKQENIRHAEVFFDPQTHMAVGLSFEEVADGLNEGLAEGRKQGIDLRLMISFLRDHPVGSPMDSGNMKEKFLKPTAWNVIKQTVQYNTAASQPGGSPGEKVPDYFIHGMGLDNNEVGFPPTLFADVYKFGREHNMYGVAHAGEEGPPDYIWESIDSIKVIRVDHAVRAVEDPELVSFMVTPSTRPQIVKWFNEPSPLPCTVCPMSNWKLKVFADPTRTDIVDMLDMGMRATVNPDDPAYFGSSTHGYAPAYVTENYLFLLKVLDKSVAKERPITFAHIYQLCRNGFLASVLHPSQKLAYLKEVDDYFLTRAGFNLFNETMRISLGNHQSAINLKPE